MISVLFDSYDMQAGGVTVTDTDIFSIPKRNVQDVRLADSDGSVVIRTSYEPKTSTIDGYLQADTVAELDALLDTFKRNMNKQGVNLDIDYNGSTRRYVATTQNMSIARPGGLNYASFSIELLIPSGVGTDITEASLGTATFTTSTGELAIDVLGSYKAEPIITLTLTALTGGTGVGVTIQNSDTLRGMTITRTWTAGDIVDLDCLNKTVYVNNIITEYSGQLPSWEPGAGTISYVDAFTTRSVDLAVTFTPRYL